MYKTFIWRSLHPRKHGEKQCHHCRQLELKPFGNSLSYWLISIRITPPDGWSIGPPFSASPVKNVLPWASIHSFRTPCMLAQTKFSEYKYEWGHEPGTSISGHTCQEETPQYSICFPHFLVQVLPCQIWLLWKEEFSQASQANWISLPKERQAKCHLCLDAAENISHFFSS